MKFLKMKSALMTMTALAIGACALPAVAQNDAYRQGYDEGYRAGMEAARTGQGRGAPQRGRVHIDQALYGVDNLRCDARNTLQDAVQGRMSVDVVANNSLCGDPAEGRVKNLLVTYRCGNSRPVRNQVREDTVLQIRCR